MLTACPHTTPSEPKQEPKTSDDNYDDTQEWHGGFASDQFWWGTWQRMDNGELYEISENKVKIYRGTATNPAATYNISNASTETSLVVTSLGTYTKTSDRINEVQVELLYFSSNWDSSSQFNMYLDGLQIAHEWGAGVNANDVSIKKTLSAGTHTLHAQYWTGSVSSRDYPNSRQYVRITLNPVAGIPIVY